MPAPKFAQELAKRIINTKGVLASERVRPRRLMARIAGAEDGAMPADARTILLALQVAARDEQVWTALVAARAALGKP